MVKISLIIEGIKSLKAKFESWKETMEIVHDSELMKDIREGEEDIKAGRTIDWEDFKKELKIEI